MHRETRVPRGVPPHSARKTAAQPARGEAAHGRVLVVDDYAAARESMSVALRAAGHEVDCVSSGAEALATTARDPYDVILTDLQMPGMDGLELIRQLARRNDAAQVLVVTHSPQVAARAEAHWRIAKAGGADHVRTAVEVLSPADREEEIARMLAGAQITDAARAAARALMDA